MGKKHRSKKKIAAAIAASETEVALIEKPVKAAEIDWGAFKLDILADTIGGVIPLKKDKKVKVGEIRKQANIEH